MNAKKLFDLSGKVIIITGAASSNSKISDFVLEENKEYMISGKKFLLEIMVVGAITLRQFLSHLQKEIQSIMQ